MTLHPQAQALCDFVNAAGGTPSSDETLQEARDGLGLLYASGAGEVQDVYAVGDLDADGVPVRVYRPSDADGLPVIVFLHGGGWAIGSVEIYDPIARALANAAQATVVSVEYRLAPEHPFPAPLDDCWTALQWAAKHASLFEADGSRLAIVGDSAGGNLAATCALVARDEGAPDLALQVLVYPVTNFDFSTPSYAQNGVGRLLEEQRMRWFWDCYTRGVADTDDWRLSPLRVPDAAGVAPALVLTAEHDPLRDEGEAYAKRLADVGVPVEQTRYAGMIHPFWALPSLFDDARPAMDQVGAALRRAFGTAK
jgi:acetyl esterase